MKNPSRLGMQFVTVVLVVFGIQTAAQTPAVARKPGTPVTAKLSRPASKPPAAAKKISFGVDSFSAKRQLLDARANSLSPQDLENQKKSASAGAPDAMYLMGAYSRNAGDDAAARTWWSQASQRDYLFAMVALAELPGVDASEKRKWLEKAAALGAAPAQFSLGKLLLVSQGGPQELAIGKSMLLKSAQSGCVDAMVLVGASYLGLSREYPGLFEQNPSLAVQYLGAAKLAHSDEARAILHLAVEKGLLPDPFAGKPQLESGEPFLSYLRQLDKEDRVFYLRQQIARNPQSPLRTKALEEVIWLVPDPSNAPEFAGLKAADPENLTVQLFSLSGKLDREFGRPLVNIEHGDIKTASDVVNRWKKASGFDNLLARTFVLSRETSIVFGDDNVHETYCATDGKSVRYESPYDSQTFAAKNGVFQFYRPLEDYQSFSTIKAAPKSNNQIAYLGNCLNLPDAVRWTEDFKFNGIKTFMGAPVYALLHNGDGHEDYFDLKSFQFLGSAGAKDSWTTNYFGFRDFGGAVLPQFRLYHNGSNIRLAKLEGLQLDVPPQVETDLFALAFTQVNNFPVLKPILTHAIKNNALDQSALLLQNVGKLETVHDTQFGLDNAAQEQRRGLIARLKAEVNDVDQKHKQWDDIGKAVMGVVIQHDRVRRFKNPTGAADVYLNWRDVTNLDSLLKHKSIRVERKVSFSGSNATLEYCAMDDQGDRRNEAVNSFLDVQNKERQVSFDLKKRSVTSHYEYTELTPELLVRNNLSRCLFSVGEAAMIYYMLPKTRYGTGKLNQRDALVIMLPDPDGNDGTYYFFDKETYVLLGHKYHKDGEPISYYDFRQVGEAIIPFKEYEYTGGQYPSDSIRSIEKIDLDVPIDAKEFALDPPVYQNLHATELREKRAELYKTGGSVWGALLTGTLQGLAGGGNSPILEAGNRSAAQLRALGDQIAARQLAQKAVNLNARPMSGVNVPQPQIAAAQQITVAIDRSQLQALAGLVQANSDAGGQDATSALLLGTLKGLSGENDSPILAAGNEQAAALRQIGDANAAAHNSPPADSTGSATGAGSSTGNASATGTASASANAGASSSPTHHTGTSPMATNCLRVVKDRDSYKFTNTCSSIIQVAVAQPYPDGRPNGAMTFQLFPNDSYRDGDSSDSRLHYWACMGSNGPADANTMAAPRSDSANVICPTGGNAGVAY